MTEIATIKINKEKLLQLVEARILMPDQFEVISIDVPDWEYERNEAWVEQKKIANKAYKKLKEIEFLIRHK